MDIFNHEDIQNAASENSSYYEWPQSEAYEAGFVSGIEWATAKLNERIAQLELQNKEITNRLLQKTQDHGK